MLWVRVPFFAPIIEKSNGRFIINQMPDESIEIGDGVYYSPTGPTEEGNMVAPTSKNRVWLTPEGNKKAGGQFKNGQQVESNPDVDIK